MDKFDETCRTCNTLRSNLLSLYSNVEENDTIRYLDILCIVCPSLTIQSTDELPQKICYYCSKQLEIAHKFQLQCKKSDDELWKLVKANIKEEQPQAQLLEIEETLASESTYNNIDETSGGDDYHDDSTVFSESPEFLEQDDEMQVLWEGKEVSEETLELEENVDQSPVTFESVASFACNHCYKSFFTSDGLGLHSKLAHKNLKPTAEVTEATTFDCKFCHLLFDSRCQERAHYHFEHKAKSKHICHICSKVFIGKNRLDHHLLYHEKHRFKCKIKDCNRTFVVKYKLTDHMKRFHGIVLSTNETKALRPYLTKEQVS